MSITDTRTPPTIKPAKVNDAKEIYQLAQNILQTVYEKFQINLEIEVNII